MIVFFDSILSISTIIPVIKQTRKSRIEVYLDVEAMSRCIKGDIILQSHIMCSVNGVAAVEGVNYGVIAVAVNRHLLGVMYISTSSITSKPEIRVWCGPNHVKMQWVTPNFVLKRHETGSTNESLSRTYHKLPSFPFDKHEHH